MFALEDAHDNRSVRRTPSLTFLDDGTRLQTCANDTRPTQPPTHTVPSPGLAALPAPETKQPVLAMLPAPIIAQDPAENQATTAIPAVSAPTPQRIDLGAHIARMAQLMKGNASFAEKAAAMKELRSVAIVEKGSRSPKAGRKIITTKRPLVTPTPTPNQSRKEERPQVRHPRDNAQNDKKKQVVTKGSPSVLESPELKLPGTGKLSKLIYVNSLVYFSPGRDRG